MKQGDWVRTKKRGWLCRVMWVSDELGMCSLLLRYDNIRNGIPYESGSAWQMCDVKPTTPTPDELEQWRSALANVGLVLAEEADALRQERDTLKSTFDRQVGGEPIWEIAYSEIWSLREENERLKADCRTLEMGQADAMALVLNHESVIERLKQEAAEQDAERLRGTIIILLTALPDSTVNPGECWKWAWDELDSEAQDFVKQIRQVAEKALT